MNDKELIEKINRKKAKIGIIGMGYVGVPLGIEFANNGLEVIGFDTDNEKVKNINSGKQIMKHIPQESMKKFIDNGNKLEPVESVFLDLEEGHTGVVTEKLSKRKGRMTNLLIMVLRLLVLILIMKK